MRFVEVDRAFEDDEAAKSSAPVLLETFAGSTLLHRGSSAVGNCERDYRSVGSLDCPSTDTIRKELVGPPPASDFGARDDVRLECSDATSAAQTSELRLVGRSALEARAPGSEHVAVSTRRGPVPRALTRSVAGAHGRRTASNTNTRSSMSVADRTSIELC